MHIIGNPQFLKSSFALSILEFARMFYVKSIIIVSRHTDFMIASFVIFFTACKIIKKSVWSLDGLKMMYFVLFYAENYKMNATHDDHQWRFCDSSKWHNFLRIVVLSQPHIHSGTFKLGGGKQLYKLEYLSHFCPWKQYFSSFLLLAS